MDDCISSLDIIRGAIYYTEETILPNERTDLVSTNKLGHGWAYQKLANQQAISELAARMAVIGCQIRGCIRFVGTKAVRSTQRLKSLAQLP